MIIPWPFSPLVLRPALWLDASDASTLYSGASLAAADGAISEWRDKSGNARHATQATGVSQPLRKTAIQNGRDVVRFDGANDGLYLPNFLAGSAGTVFVVRKNNSSYPPVESIGADISGWGTAAGLYDHSPYINGQFYSSFGRSSRINVSSPSVPVTNFHLLELVSTVVWQMKFNGSVSVTIGGNVASWSTTPYLGFDPVGLFFAGDIAEILFFQYGLTVAQAQAIYSYINAKWNLY